MHTESISNRLSSPGDFRQLDRIGERKFAVTVHDFKWITSNILRLPFDKFGPFFTMRHVASLPCAMYLYLCYSEAGIN